MNDASVSRQAYRWPRVLLVTPQPFYEDRGTPIAVRSAVAALCELNYAVDVLAFPFGVNVQIPGLTVHRCRSLFNFDSVPIGFSLKKLVLDASLIHDFEELLSTRKYDVVHAVEEAAYMASVLCPRYGIPYVYDMASSIPAELNRHPLFGNRPAQALLQAAERKVIGRATHVLCSSGLSQHVQQQAKHASISEWIFPAPFKTPDLQAAERMRRDLGLNSRHRVIVYSGNFAGYQGIDTLMNAFELAQRHDDSLRLVCVGATGAERESWQKKLDPETSKKVTILSRKPRDEISAYLCMADCLVSLRLKSDNLPLKVFEYMAAGRPIVATRGPAHEPTLNDKRAYLCSGNPGSVAKAMLKAVHSFDCAESIAREAQRYASRHFSWDAFKDLVQSVYDQTLVHHMRTPDRSGSASPRH